MTDERGAVGLVEVSRENVVAVCQLALHDHQRHLVGPAATTVAYAHYAPSSLLRAIVVDGEIAGVLLVLRDEPVPHLVRFHVDAGRQGQGVGRAAVEILCDLLQRYGERALHCSYVPVDGGAGGFWERVGFRPTGEIRDGEPVVERLLG